MRILWISDSPTTPSGFGAVTREVCGRLAARGHRIDIVGWQTHGAPTRWNGITVHPVRRDLFGADVLHAYLMRIQPEWVVTLADVWWMSFLTDPPVQDYLDRAGARWCLYYPIDGADAGGTLPPGWRRMLETADLPVAMSRFGQAVTRACGVEAAYLPHGVDLDVFRPPADRTAAKERLGYEGRFVVLSDARNQPRKLLPRLLDIAAAFAHGRDDVVVHLHTDPEDEAARSDLYRYALREDAVALGLQDTVRLTAGFRMRASGGLPVGQLAQVYQAADVHLLTSWGEGFGLPNLQAAAAGVVPMAAAHAASRELVEGHGFALPIDAGVTDEFGLVRGLVSRDAAVHALARLHADRDELADRSRRSREFALGYGWDGIVADWERLLAGARPRRRPVRSRSFDWIAGAANDTAALPAPVASAALDAFAPLPDGTKLSIRVAERRHGEVAAEIRRTAFLQGDELSVPVRLPAAFPGAPRPRVGSVLVAPGDLELAVRLRRIFPGLEVSVPRPDGDPGSTDVPELAEIVPALVHCALAIDWSRGAVPGLDLACAVLGVPYAGRSPLWPSPGGGSPLLATRRLLTDQGLSERRRRIAAERAIAEYGERVAATLRALALAGQPRAGRPAGEEVGAA